jgi:hypothetical protein
MKRPGIPLPRRWNCRNPHRENISKGSGDFDRPSFLPRIGQTRIADAQDTRPEILRRVNCCKVLHAPSNSSGLGHSPSTARSLLPGEKKRVIDSNRNMLYGSAQVVSLGERGVGSRQRWTRDARRFGCRFGGRYRKRNLRQDISLPLWTVDKARSGETSGTGLRLSIVKRMVEAHRCSIEL